MDPTYFALLPILFVGGIISTIGGGGLGIVVILIGTFFLDIRTAIAFSSVLMLAQQIAKLTFFYKEIRWRTVVWYLVLGIPMSIVGGWTLFMVPKRVPEILIAVLCLTFIVLKLFRLAPRCRATKLTLLLFGGINGFFGGLIGNAALIRLPVMLSLGYSKGVLIGTSAAAAFPMNLGKIAAYIPNIAWTEEIIQLLILAVPTLLTSVWIGKKILRHMSKALFENLLLAIITLGAFKLLFFS